jgi:hypothetical protein
MEVRNRQQNLGFNGYVVAMYKFTSPETAQSFKPVEEKAMKAIRRIRGKFDACSQSVPHIDAGYHDKSGKGVVLMIRQQLYSADKVLQKALTKLGFNAQVVEEGIKPFDVFNKMVKEIKK